MVVSQLEKHYKAQKQNLAAAVATLPGLFSQGVVVRTTSASCTHLIWLGMNYADCCHACHRCKLGGR